MEYLDSRTLQERIDELEEEEELDIDDTEELEKLNNFKDKVDSSEWEYGITFIPEEEFEEYCRELVTDIGDLPSDLPGYIENNISWSGIAEDLQVDYSCIEFQGTDYLYRF